MTDHTQMLIEDDEAVTPILCEYFTRRMYDLETRAKPVREMTADEVGDVVLRMCVGMTGSREPLVRKLAEVIISSRTDGGLLMAGGAKYLSDLGTAVVSRRERSMLAVWSARVMQHVVEVDGVGGGGYWDRLERRNDFEADRMCREFGPTIVGEHLKHALEPLPLDSIRYCLVDWLDEGQVQEANDHVEKFSPHATEAFKVVSMSLASDPSTIRSNLIYTKGITGDWTMLISVDFAQHGRSPPGHWHLNRAPNSQIIDHYAFKGEGWHGPPDLCPLWWMLIPHGCTYLVEPDRIRCLKKQMSVKKP